MNKEEALIESSLDLVSTPFENMTHPSRKESPDKINLRVTNPSEIFDIHEESTMKIGEEDDISEHEIYSITISLNPCPYETSPESIDLSIIITHNIFNPFTLSVHKNFKRMVVDAYLYHKYCKSCCVLEMDIRGETTLPNHILKVSQGKA